MLKQEDLPAPWVLEHRFLSVEENRKLDLQLGITEELVADDVETGQTVIDGHVRKIEFPKPGNDKARHVFGGYWSTIRNETTDDKVMLRTQKYGRGAVISGVIFLPKHPDQSINGQTLRSLPISTIEENVNVREWEKNTSWGVAISTGVNPLDPLGDPRISENFHERAAFQFIFVKKKNKDPVSSMAKINNVSEKTVQGWLTQARKMKLLPPSRPGKRG